MTLPHRAAMDALESGAPLPASGQIAREIAAFRDFYGPTLRPAMFLSYEREAYYPIDGEDFPYFLTFVINTTVSTSFSLTNTLPPASAS